jgi:ribosomal protein S18 acetylase RimI-like enzyme
MIRKAKKEEIHQILSITKACTKHLISKNIFQWDENYPSQDALEKDLKRNELFVIIFEEKVLGCIALTSKIDNEYLPIKWLTQNKNNLYVHRLAIHPNSQGKGFAQQLMDFAETFAVKNNFISIRLDTFSKNKRNQKFYELRGYKRLGNVYFLNQSKDPFFCYELVLSP